MPRYYIDIIDNGRVFHDKEGTDFSGDKEAREEAIGVLPDIARDELPDGDVHVFESIVRNQRGHAIFRAKLMLDCVWLGSPSLDGE